MRKILLLALSLLFSGCALSMQPLEPSKLTKAEKLGVVVVDENKLKLELIGTTAFNNVFKKKDIKQWKLIDFITDEIHNNLNSKSNLTVVDTQYDRNDILDKTGIALNKSLKTVMSENGLDYILLVSVSFLNSKFSGIKLSKRQFLKTIKSSLLDISYSFSVYSKIDTKEIYNTSTWVQEKIDNSIWDNGEKEISKEELNTLESITKKVLKSEIPKNLEKLGLIRK